jgi:hypothetical protein
VGAKHQVKKSEMATAAILKIESDWPNIMIHGQEIPINNRDAKMVKTPNLKTQEGGICHFDNQTWTVTSELIDQLLWNFAG